MHETIWLTLLTIADLFGVKRPAVTKIEFLEKDLKVTRQIAAKYLDTLSISALCAAEESSVSAVSL